MAEKGPSSWEGRRERVAETVKENLRALGILLSELSNDLSERMSNSSKYIVKLKPEIEHTRLPNVKKSGDYFVYLVRPGDTLSGIKQNLQRDTRFAYLKKPGSLRKFGIPAQQLKAGTYILVPPEHTVIKPEALASAIDKALDKMKRNRRYSEFVKAAERALGREKFTALLLAIAEKESTLGAGGLIRWENADHLRTFSLGYFQVLLKGDGQTAFRNLGMKMGDALDPVKGAELAIAFLAEKSAGDPGRMGIGKGRVDFDQMAGFYNGLNWQKVNPTYSADLSDNFQKALGITGSGRGLASR